MTYAPHSKDNSSQQNQQQTAKATAQTFSDNRESNSASSPLQAMMANSPQQQKLKSTAQLMAYSPAQQKLNSTSQNFANTSEPMQRMDDEEPLQGKFETESEPAQLEAAPEAPRPNNTGLPDNLKAGIENLSGMSMDHVRVHYNSDKPAQLQAHAYAQGSETHVAPGQEQHLPHEAWHVVQQAQGRVRPTMQMKGSMQVNDDLGLESEADVMGEKAIGINPFVAQREIVGEPVNKAVNNAGSPLLSQRKMPMNQDIGAIIQCRVDPDFTTFLGAGVPTKPMMQVFYDRYVVGEITRLSSQYIDDDIKTAMNRADLYFKLFMLNSRDMNEIMGKLNALILTVNAAADSVDNIITANRAARAVGHEGDPNYIPDAVTEKRDERERRKGATHYVGTTKGMPLRGVQSNAEGEAILANLQAALNGSLGVGFPLGNVGVRGSAITGIRSRNQQSFAEGLGAHDDVSDASDLDFFFTCPALEVQIRATQNHLPADRRINAGGTMNAQYLSRWLNLPQAQNGYANAAALLAALKAFETATENLIGRKSDVTFVGGATAAGLAGDAGTLIL